VKQIAVCTVIFSSSAHLSSIFTQIYGAASDIIKKDLVFVLMPFRDERFLSNIRWYIAIIILIPFILISHNFSSNGHEQIRCDRRGERD
jgi:hypothetical protein